MRQSEVMKRIRAMIEMNRREKRERSLNSLAGTRSAWNEN
jgi:hypothetical protein